MDLGIFGLVFDNKWCIMKEMNPFVKAIYIALKSKEKYLIETSFDYDSPSITYTYLISLGDSSVQIKIENGGWTGTMTQKCFRTIYELGESDPVWIRS